MLKRGEQFIKKLMEARPKIVKHVAPFLKDGSVSKPVEYSVTFCNVC